MKRLALLLLVVGLWATCESMAQAHGGYTSYYRPAVAYYHPAPVAYTSYYPAPVVVAAPAYQPVTRVRTRYRPILGGTVTRYRTYYAPAPVVYAY